MAKRMTEAVFIDRNQERWKRLEAYNERLRRKNIKTLTREESREFAQLYRLVGYHLAYAKTHFPNGTSLAYLQHLAGVAHNVFYVREKFGIKPVWDYFLSGFPEMVRRARGYFWISTALFIAGMIFAYLYVAADVSRFNLIFPYDAFGGSSGGNGGIYWDYPLMSAYIMTNNIRVAVMVFAFGITAGIGTVWLLFYNGLIIGALAAHTAVTGGTSGILNFWSLILPHGILELYAIFLSGACGLMIGRGLLIPGDYTRKHSLLKAAREAAMMIPGIAALLIIAGLIEGFFTPLDISPYLKLGFAALTLAGTVCLFGLKKSPHIAAKS